MYLGCFTLSTSAFCGANKSGILYWEFYCWSAECIQTSDWTRHLVCPILEWQLSIPHIFKTNDEVSKNQKTLPIFKPLAAFCVFEVAPTLTGPPTYGWVVGIIVEFLITSGSSRWFRRESQLSREPSEFRGPGAGLFPLAEELRLLGMALVTLMGRSNTV